MLIRIYIFLTLVTVFQITAFSQNRPKPLGNPDAKGNADMEVKKPSKKGSQIIDDTTRQIYGPRTSKYYYENDVFYNRNVTYQIDTAIENFHRFSYVQRYNNLYQDLGTIGMAIQPIFYQSPEQIGVSSGLNVYDVYWNADPVKYFDTKSPYSNMNVILGGKGRSITKASFSRNVNSRWNFGMNYRGLFIDKQVPQRRGKGDRVVKSNYYDFYTAYHTKDSIYRIFINYRRMFHRVIESGGVVASLEDGAPALNNFAGYFSDNARVFLSAAESNDLRSNFHFSQQVQIGKGLQLYHTLDRYRQKARFQDNLRTDKDVFDYKRINKDTAWDVGKFKTVRNEVGVKGNLLKLFYNGYYAIRHYNMTYNQLPQMIFPSNPKGDENYLGGRMELNIDSIGLVNGWAEVNNDGNFRIEGNIRSRWFEATLKQLKYKPSFVQNGYVGTFNLWGDSAFADTESSQLNGYIHYRSKVFNISPGVTFTRLKNYVFFDSTAQTNVQKVTPVQSTGNQIIFSPELNLSIRFLRHVIFSSQVIYTSLLENAEEAIRVPDLFINTQLAYRNIHYNGNLDMQAGVDIHWKSAYFAPAYDPALRQFYNQDYFQSNAFPVVDVFFNAKIKRGRIFLKYHNLVQAFTKTGYFPTPIYTGQRNIVDFGFDWSFYD